ncbi:YbhB/YbcL family Raf kinase inhibitor-like protein [Halarcobacter ebronensis]|uniref:YbhB/YbcL family Raf kinase inhibitor-like protein n=1 Tax=Halarcobacter ebronensis TaxID=1462615 RepID=A0A4Q0YBY8_9BACT|nr:YbhB/YbcL family Raf kinase inhibitor-like protein [Halarcobacter ebronensis]RXJ66381.1 YbhB/YbcL family Raf kinase inhibitor-like protein [Halarcobacter ebronensis]
MKKLLILLVFGITILFADNFTLKSDDLKGQLTSKQVFNGFGCVGENISPKLSWSGAPKETKSFALTVYDPDAPTGSGWWHWIVFDIPKDKTSLEEGFGNKISKDIVQSITDYGKPGFGGACPPKGDKAHRYVFTIYALDVEKLGLDENANAATVGFTLNFHALQRASIISYYGR